MFQRVTWLKAQGTGDTARWRNSCVPSIDFHRGMGVNLWEFVRVTNETGSRDRTNIEGSDGDIETYLAVRRRLAAFDREISGPSSRSRASNV